MVDQAKPPVKRSYKRKATAPVNSLVNRDSLVAIGTIFVLTLLIALMSFVVSFEALKQLAEGSAISWASLWPLINDGFIIVATIAAYVLHGKKIAWYPWVALILFAIISIVGNAYHAVLNADELIVPIPVAAAISAVPPLALLISSHLLVVMLATPKKPKLVNEVVAEELKEEVKATPTPVIVATTQPQLVARPVKPAMENSELTAWAKARMAESLPITSTDLSVFLGDGISTRTAQRKLSALRSGNPELDEYCSKE
jgi:Protein of unknown function (DUF2637)